jgi:hypothetical protein
MSNESQTLNTRLPVLATSTATAVQRQRMILMLRSGDKSTFDFRRAGIMQSSTRVFELRALGYDIATVDRRDMYDADGFRHRRVAVYRLIAEPLLTPALSDEVVA